MCRISGYMYLGAKTNDNALDEAVIKKMNDSLEHGGPDDTGIYIDESVALGHKRLSVIDLSPLGHQPYLWNEYVMVYNGEVYNYTSVQNELKELGYTFQSTSDTEVIIKAFHEWGLSCVDKFRGMFAFAIWNKKQQTLTLCRDRIGVKPLYWYNYNGLFMFASELKAFHHHPQFDKSISHAAVSLYLQTGYIRSPFCIFENAHKLTPGTYLEVKENGELKQTVYWDLDQKARDAVLNEREDNQIIKETEDVLTEAFNYRMVSDVPVGIFLSGGIDSSLVTALIQKDRTTPIDTFTIGFEDSNYDESPYAALIAKHIGTNHHTHICGIGEFDRITELLPDLYDEPFGDSSAIPTTLVSEIARKDVTVSLSADAGDEIFTGYERYVIANKYFDKIRNLPHPLRSILSNAGGVIPISMAKRIFESLPFFPHVNHFDLRYPKMLRGLKSKTITDFLMLVSSSVSRGSLKKLHKHRVIPIFDNPTGTGPMQKFGLFTVADGKSYLEGDIMTKVDRATMSVALEAREPFLDHKIIEHALTLPDKFKIRDNKSKWVLREILYKYVPQELIDRPKQGFGIPFAEWLRTSYSDELEKMSSDVHFLNFFKLEGTYMTEQVTLFVKGKESNLEQSIYWYLFVLYRWYKRWI